MHPVGVGSCNRVSDKGAYRVSAGLVGRARYVFWCRARHLGRPRNPGKGSAMTAATIERVSPASDQGGEVDWRALLEQAMTMPGRLGEHVLPLLPVQPAEPDPAVVAGRQRAVRTVQRVEGAGPDPRQGRRPRGAAPEPDPQDRRGDRRKGRRSDAVPAQALRPSLTPTRSGRRWTGRSCPSGTRSARWPHSTSPRCPTR